MEQVNHPSHYNLPGKKECIMQMLEDYGRQITATFCLTNAYKYLYRAGNKEGASVETDLSKARWYFDFVNDHLFSSINGSYSVKLYRDVKDMLKRGKK